LTPDYLGLSGLSPLRSVIEHPPGLDRSRDSIRAAGDLLREGFTKLQVLGILLNPKNKISAHCLDQADPRRAALRVLKWLEEHKSDEAKEQEQKEPGHILPPLSIAEWRARMDLSNPDYLLGYWLTTTTRCLLTATTGLGKTNLAMGIALRVAAGAGFLCWTGPRKARVLYIDGEMSRRLLRKRILAEADRLGVDPEGLFALSREDVEGMPALNTPQGQAWMDAFIEKIGGIDLIIIDNIMCLTIGDMKDPAAWQNTLPWVLSLTKRNIGQIWIHHTGHDESRSYGDKSREWQMDTTIHLDRVKREDTDVSFSLRFDKARERTPETRDDFRLLNVTLIDDVWQHTIDKSAGQQSSKGETTIRAAINEALIDHGFDHRVRGAGPTVRAVELRHVEDEFNRRYLLSGQSKNPEDARRKAFERALRATYIGRDVRGQKQLVWIVRQEAKVG
jgi:AAA domain-containing protein